MKHFLASFKCVISSVVIFTLIILITQSLPLITSGPATIEDDPPTKVSVSPKTLTGPPGWININDTFTINLTVSDVIDLFYWQAGLSFNPTVLQCVNFTEGPFLKAGGDTVWQPGTIDNEEGLITPHGATLTDGGSVIRMYVIGASKDDAYSKSDDLKWTDTYYYLSRSDIRSGCRWSIDIPKGAVIEQAYFTCRAKGSSESGPICRIQVFDQDSCDDFDVIFWDWAVMPGAVDWNLPSFTPDTWYTSPDLKTIIQAYIDRPGYVSGNYLGLKFVWQGGSEPGHEVWAWDSSSNSAAKLIVTYSIRGAGVSGNGTLAFIAFKMEDAGVSSLFLQDVILLDFDYEKIEPVELQHGHFELPPSPEPRPPNAYFFYYPLTPYVNETVTFNASESTPNGGTIENYEWDFDDGSQGQGMIVNHTYTSVGEYDVTLTVTDSENLSDTFSRLVPVLPLLPGASIDVYTQRDGKGLNESSDAFAPQEMVILTAYLTYNRIPVAGKLVTFRVYLPNGAMMWSRTSNTTDNGLGFSAYLTPSKPVSGLYSITASASVEGETVSDTIWFRVGWLVEVLEVLPCDRNGAPKNQFEIGEPLYLRVKLENIRFHPTSVELTVAVLDVFLQPVTFEADEYIIAPNQTTVFLNPGAIPEWAYVGNATAHVNAFQWHGGPPYCPEVSAWFMVTIPIPDVAVVGVTTSSFEIYVGQSVNITVSVLNEYYRPQSFNVTIYANTTVTQTLTISNLTPYIPTNFTFVWDTYTVSPGNYIISALASAVPGEKDTADNTYINGIVKIVQPRAPAKTVVCQGYLCEINVAITNEGNFTETFNVTLYADKNTTIIEDEITIGIQNVTLTSGNSTTVTFTWNTTGVAKGNYTITVKATPVPGKTDTTPGTVLVTIPGDVNGDGKVRVDDILAIALAFGTDCGGPPNSNGYFYDPNLDITNDLKIRIDDVLIAALNFGETDP